MTTKALNRGQRIASIQKLVAGLTQHADTLSTLMIAGTSHKTTDIISTLQGVLSSAQTVVTAKANWQAAVQADKQGRAKNQPLISDVRQALYVAFGNSIDTLADFGLTQKKTRVPRTPAQKAASTAKAKATRAARHTMGSKQKAQIKGTVTGTVDSSSSMAPAPGAASTATPPAPGASPQQVPSPQVVSGSPGATSGSPTPAPSAPTHS
jgi:hypothetical protein